MKKFLILMFLLLAFPHPSLAFYGDTEKSLDNAISTTILDLVLGSGQTNFTPDPDLLEPGDVVTRDYYLSKTSASQSERFNISYQYLSGNSTFCQQFNFQIKSASNTLYNQPLISLVGFTDPDFLINSDTPKHYLFQLTLPNTTPPEFQDQTCHFKFIFTAWQDNLPDPSTGFVDIEDSDNILTTPTWALPQSWLTTTPLDTQTSSSFSIEYDSENNVDYVELWYSYNLGSWISFGHDHPHSPGTFSFTSPRGDGLYRFITQAYAHNGQQESPNWSNYSETTVDTTPPLTTLSLPEFGANRFASRDTAQNGNFEDPTALSGWQIDGSGDHSVIFDGLNRVAQIGFSQTTPVADSQDSIYQIIPLPADSATLSFRYNFSSYDVADTDQFNVYLKDSGFNTLETVWHAGNYTGIIGDLYQTGWQEVTHSLANFASSSVNLWFEVSNRLDSLWHTWAQLDDIHVTLGTNNLPPGTPLTINATDAVGTGVVAVNYQIGNSPPETSLNPVVALTINTGTTLTYWSEDAVGHTDTPTTISLNTPSNLSQIVLNQFIPLTSGSLPELVWLYNIGDTFPVDVKDWQICHDDNTLPKYHPSDPNIKPADPTPDICLVLKPEINPGNQTEIQPLSDLMFYLVDIGSTHFAPSPEQATIFLLNPDNLIVDSYFYKDAAVDKIFKRNPVGTGAWSDPEPQSNLLSYFVSSQYSDNKLKFKTYYLPTGSKYELEVTYISNDLEKGIFDTHNFIDQSLFEKELFLGTCTSNGICLPDSLIANLNFNFIYIYQDQKIQFIKHF